LNGQERHDAASAAPVVAPGSTAESTAAPPAES
jgi:hypothetical protein